MADLTDVQSVRQYLQQSASNRLQDDDLETIIPQVTEAFQRFTNREFARTNGATRSFEYVPTGWYDVIDLAPYEIRTLSGVQLDPDLSGGVALTSTQYRLKPYPPRDQTFFYLRLNEVPPPTSTNAEGATLPFFSRRLDVTGDWGTVEVPEEIQHFANLTVKAWAELKHDTGVVANPEFGEGRRPQPEDFPPGVRMGLRQRWMRPEAMI